MREKSSAADLDILLVPSVRLITRAPAGGIMASGTRKILPPRPPSFFHFLPPESRKRSDGSSKRRAREEGRCCACPCDLSSFSVPSPDRLLTIHAVEALGDVPCELQVLPLVLAHRHQVRLQRAAERFRVHSGSLGWCSQGTTL